MSIRINDREVTAVRYGSRVIAAVYRGGRLLWQAVSSCFGAGWWVNSRPWSDKEGWKN
jgi:hypothetical protein